MWNRTWKCSKNTNTALFWYGWGTIWVMIALKGNAVACQNLFTLSCPTSHIIIIIIIILIIIRNINHDKCFRVNQALSGCRLEEWKSRSARAMCSLWPTGHYTNCISTLGPQGHYFCQHIPRYQILGQFDLGMYFQYVVKEIGHLGTLTFIILVNILSF